MSDPKTYQFNLPKSGRPSDVCLPEVWYPGIKKYWETSTSKRTVEPILGIKAVIIHATAGGSSAGAISVMKRKEGAASFHWQVEITAQIIRYCWAKYPNLVHVVSHAKLDPARRTDPGADFPWDQFKQLVLSSAPDEVPAIALDAIPATKIKADKSVAGSCCEG